MLLHLNWFCAAASSFVFLTHITFLDGKMLYSHELILQIAKITEEGVTISQPYALKTSWNLAAFKNPTVGAEGPW